VYFSDGGGNFYALDAANGGHAGSRGSIKTARTAKVAPGANDKWLRDPAALKAFLRAEPLSPISGGRVRCAVD
jgi:hypothetical protein